MVFLIHLGRTFDSSIPFEPKSWKSIVERYRMGRDEVIPPEGLDLLDKLLKLMPEERITAREALQHPFLRN